MALSESGCFPDDYAHTTTPGTGMFMHELFSLQIDIDVLNPRSSLILYF